MEINAGAIKSLREKYNLSLAQFGTMVGAPATSVKRWEEGLKPNERFVAQIILVAGLINVPDSIYYDLGRQGLNINKKHWDSFSSLIKSTKESLEIATELGVKSFEISSAVVSGVKGLLALITKALVPQKNITTNVSSLILKNIGGILYKQD